MKKLLKRLWVSQEGNMSVLMAGFIVLMLAVCGVVIDTGLVIEGKIKLYSATRAASKATYESYDRDLWEEERKVRLDEDIATEYASLYLNLNIPEAELVYVEVKDSRPNQAYIRTRLEVELIFMKLFGIESFEVYSGFVSTVG